MKKPTKNCVKCGGPLRENEIEDAERGVHAPACPGCNDAVLRELHSGLPWWPTDWYGNWFLAGRIWQFRPNGKFE